MEIVNDGGGDRLVHCFAIMPNKHAAALTVIESFGESISYLERAMDTGLSLEACRRQAKRNSRHTNKSSRHRMGRRHRRVLRRGAQHLGKSVIQRRHARTQLPWASCCRRPARRDRTTRWKGDKPRPSPKLGAGAYKEHEPLRALDSG